MAFTTYDNAPYLYRRSGGGGDKEIDKLVGGTIAWNQLIRNGNFADTSNWSASSGSTFTVSNNVATFRADAQYRSLTQSTPIGDRVPKLDHIYMGIIKAKSYTNTNTLFYVRSVLSTVLQTATKTLSTTENEYVNVLKVNQEANYFQFMVQDNNTSGFGDITVQNARFFDLTLMFGSTIADYVYSLEQSSQGSGLAWLRSYGFFTEDYYDYNSGELKSVSNLVSHDMTGEDASTTLHSYPLGDVTLRGLPKLNGNALYYDGDTYESNGTVTRKYGVVDMGTLSWAENNISIGGVSAKLYRSALPNSALTYNSVAFLCAKYATVKSIQRTEQSASCGTSDGSVDVIDSTYNNAASFKNAMNGVYLVYELASSTTETADTYTNPQWVDPNGTERYTLSANAFPMPVGHDTTYNTDVGSKTVNTQVNLSMTEPSVRQIYAKEGDTARVLNIHLDQTEEDGTLRILRPDGTEVTAEAVLVPEFYDGLMAEIPSDATSVVGKCYCDVEQNGVSSMPFTLNVKKNERQ